MKTSFLRAGFLLAVVALAGCNETLEDIAPKAEKSLPPAVLQSMRTQGMTQTSPIMVRIFKEEAVLEVWKQKNNGRYDLAATYDICKWSGRLGPKFTEGDRQAPEGFYMVRPHQMNPKSQYHLAFNMGFPNSYDRAHGRTGQHLMVHGACSSAGCYSMTDPQMEQIYAFARDAFKGGQTEFQVQAFPFRMTAANMARYRDDPNFEFWKMLKEGHDHFEIARVPPKVDVCGKRYVFNQMPEAGRGFQPAAACPAMSQPETVRVAYASYQAKYDAAFSAALGGQGKISTPAPTIAGMKEASLVADWSRRRARGERVTVEPPTLAQPTIMRADLERQQQEARVAAAAAAAAAAPAPVQQAAAPAPSASPLSALFPGLGSRAAQNPVAAAASPSADAPAEAIAADGTPVPVPNPQAEAATAAAPAAKPGLRSRLLGMFGG